jgi:uncharacterized membrane protein YedE/YeeE
MVGGSLPEVVVPESWLLALAGGALIGVAASLLLLLEGKVAGISSVAAQLVSGRAPEPWRVAFLVGLVGAGVGLAALAPSTIGAPLDRSPVALVAAGLLVGFGTRVSGGCTSGHGVCGLSRGSTRSLAAVLVFMGAGMLSATAVRLLGGGA